MKKTFINRYILIVTGLFKLLISLLNSPHHFCCKLLVFYLISTSVIAAPRIEHWQTTKGTRVYFVESHELPIIDIQIVFDAGSARDPKNKNGLALLTNSLFSEGADGMDADVLSFGFESLGAVFQTGSGYDYTTISLRSLSEQELLHTVLKHFKRVISMPDFPQKAIERLRNQILIGIQHKQQSPGDLAKDIFHAAVFKNHPYAFPEEGTEKSVNSIQKKDIIRFHKHYYTAANAIIVMVGDFQKQLAITIAEELTSALPSGNKAPPLPPVGDLIKAKIEKLDYESAQMHILVGQPGMKRGDPDYFPLYVGNHVLGGGGMVSRLFEEIREKRGLSYSAYSYFLAMREIGPFVAGLQTRPDQSHQAIAVLKENLESFIKNGPRLEELEASKKNITGGFPLKIDSNSDMLSYAAMIGFYNLPLDYLERFNANIEAVTIEQIKSAFQRRLAPDKFVTVMVGPVAETKETPD